MRPSLKSLPFAAGLFLALCSSAEAAGDLTSDAVLPTGNRKPASIAESGIADRAEVREFIHEMSRKHHYDESRLRSLFAGVVTQDKILELMQRPAEAKPWYAYRQLLISDERVKEGVAFWQQNSGALEAAQRRYGVPPRMIVAIIGVETRFGQKGGNYRVIDALSTLAFEYPRRAGFFRGELEQFLLLCRAEGIDPALPKGSYAGAMGLPQFMPSSFKGYAVDGNGDGRRDIWNEPADAIASVANYFAKNGWQNGGKVAFPARLKGSPPEGVLGKGLKPAHLLSRLRVQGVDTPAPLPGTTKVNLLRLEQQDGPEYWLTLYNFYVISRYNHSPLYAMAAYQLGELIAQGR